MKRSRSLLAAARGPRPRRGRRHPVGRLGAGVRREPADQPRLRDRHAAGWSCSGGTGSVVTSPVRSGSHALAGAATASDNAQCTPDRRGAAEHGVHAVGLGARQLRLPRRHRRRVDLDAVGRGVHPAAAVFHHRRRPDLGAGLPARLVRPAAPTTPTTSASTARAATRPARRPRHTGSPRYGTSTSSRWPGAPPPAVTGYRVYEGTTVRPPSPAPRPPSAAGRLQPHTYTVAAYNGAGESAQSARSRHDHRLHRAPGCPSTR